MTQRQKIKFRNDFFAQCGSNIKTLASLFESLPHIAFYIKDIEGRIVAINRYNCELCNIPSLDFAIGKRSCDLFPRAYSDFCMARDREVIKTGKPIVGRRYTKVANLSNSLNILSLYPVYDQEDRIIGTICAYYRGIPERIGPIWQEKFDKILMHINDNLSKPLTVEKLAAESGMSVANFQRLFMKVIGVRPGRYIVQQRLNAVCRLLEDSDLSILDIAVSAGFFDQSHLTKLFKRERGVTPGEYRRRHRTQTKT